MTHLNRAVTTLAVVCALPAIAVAQDASSEDGPRLGHSAHGEAFDEGPRQRPWKIEGIGHAHFPITTSVPEVQTWFDQGNTLLHNFWYYEAERAFRWCIKLDPDCAMAYWGLARAVGNRGGNERAAAMTLEAVRRKDQVTERERMYIEALEDATDRVSGRLDFEEFADGIEGIAIAYPDDLEAKAYLMVLRLWSGHEFGNDLLGRAILAENSEHVGAHHYMIHNWDDGDHGERSLDSCENYGRIAPNVGHANHMPGHVYSGLGMWHEAAIWMDSATRVEKQYMQERMTFPFNAWNYAHNRNYLAYIQEQLGMAEAAIQGARDMLNAPLDPEYNKGDGWGDVYREGQQSLVRTLVRFERWEEILDGEIPWGDKPQDELRRNYTEGLALLARGDLLEARGKLAEMKKPKKGAARGGRDGGGNDYEAEFRRAVERSRDLVTQELEARILLAEGETLDGFRILADAAEQEAEMRDRVNDPPMYPYCLYEVLGEKYLEHGAAELAVAAYERSLELIRNNAWAYAGLARAQASLGNTIEAIEAYGRMRHVWSDADPGLRWKEAAEAVGLDSEPIDPCPRPERNYRAQTLDTIGPATWIPYAAPELEVLDKEEQTVTLDDYRGQNVLLVFYIGEACVHCVEQLRAIEGKVNQFTGKDTVVLAVSSDTPAENVASEEMGSFSFPLLSDVDHANARRFKAWDDFEEIELHATILIDKEGRVRWARSGGEPFMDMKFLLSELDRIGEMEFEVASSD